jgi:hypothetical protein
MAVSTLLHWLASQAVFVGGDTTINGFTFGLCWSPVALIAIASTTFVLLIGLSVVYFIPFRSQMPVMAGSARVVIDACCKLRLPLPDLGIQWGDISTIDQRIAGFGEDVGKLEKGVSYPGPRNDGIEI